MCVPSHYRCDTIMMPCVCNCWLWVLRILHAWRAEVLGQCRVNVGSIAGGTLRQLYSIPSFQWKSAWPASYLEVRETLELYDPSDISKLWTSVFLLACTQRAQAGCYFVLLRWSTACVRRVHARTHARTHTYTYTHMHVAQHVWGEW